ncbi:MAG: polyisoprenoid-binding protein, partial [Burkholderiales bacterium]
MRRLLTALATAALLAAPAFAQGTTPAAAPAGAYVADKTHTSIEWQGLH